jgi:prolyl-tRNA editing enzyme YbaK/EbsC (Cys-tRNA(Pro) deacylase)
VSATASIYVDAGLLPLDYVILGGGSRATKIKIAPEVFRLLPAAEVIDDLASVVEPG